jgi:16S rRNA (guanine966-N2)-methyltransferase
MKIISGKYRGRNLRSPSGDGVRPTAGQLREAVFNICQSWIEGVRCLDLFAGSGAMGLEALSRGACHATFVELNRPSIKCIEENIELLHLEGVTTLYKGDALRILERLVKQPVVFDFIFADPPYDFPQIQKIVDMIDHSNLLGSDGTFFLETSATSKLDVSHLTTLKHIETRMMGKSALHRFTR